MQYFTIQRGPKKSVIVNAFHDDSFKTIVTVTGTGRSNLSFDDATKEAGREVETWDAFEEALQENSSLRGTWELRMKVFDES